MLIPCLLIFNSIFFHFDKYKIESIYLLFVYIKTKSKMEISLFQFLKVNELFVLQYFEGFNDYIRYLHRRKKYRMKNALLDGYPNVCYKCEEIKQLLAFANELRLCHPYATKEDICLALLYTFYTISLCENEDEINYAKILKNANNRENVRLIIMGISGISCSGFMKNDEWMDFGSCDESDTMYYDFDSILNKKIRRYMIMGLG